MKSKNGNLIIGSKTGSSMLFVLGVMLLLLTIGVSALVAASSNKGAELSGRVSKQLNLYTDSIHKSVKYSFETGGNDVGETASGTVTIGGKLLFKAYDEAYAVMEDALDDVLPATPDYSDPDIYEIYAEKLGELRPITNEFTPFEFTEITLTDAPALSSAIEDVTVNMSSSVVINPFKPERPDEPGISGSDRVPQTALIGGKVTVTVKATHMGRSVTSVAAYRLTDAVLQDTGDNDDTYVDEMEIVDAGKWGFVSYEKVDS